MPDLLLELFSEEIPARMQKRAAEDLRRLVTDGLVAAGLTYASAGAFATPRRLALSVQGLSAHSPTTREARRGPRVDAPEKALEGFLRGVGLTRADLSQVEEKKGTFWMAEVVTPGRPAADILAELIPQVVLGFPWPKSMRWGSGALRWVRPLHRILCLLSDEAGAQVVPFEVGGIVSGDQTEGHRFMAPGAFAVTCFDDYAAKLQRAHVVLDAAARAETIWAEATNMAFAAGLEVVEDPGLLAEVAGLVEWPVVLMGEIGADFLDLPAEVLQTSMREHQKFFSVRDKAGRILRFITVANRETADDGATILAGNAKVLSARLSDAKFFWENDLRTVARAGMKAWTDQLAQVTFHAKLGSQAERIDRIATLARDLAPVVGAKPDLAEEAARVAKADLASEMVYEFPELQGTMGAYYARAAGHNDGVPEACVDHWQPLGPSDDVPRAPLSVAVALADKIDTLAGFWAIDEKPTGSKDPYALRRAALGVIRLVLENDLRLGLKEMISNAALGIDNAQSKIENQDPETPLNLRNCYAEMQGIPREDLRKLEARAILKDQGVKSSKELVEKNVANWKNLDFNQFEDVKLLNSLLAFFHDRLKVFLRDQGVAHDVIDACLAMPGSDDLVLLVKRARALQAVLSTEDGENLVQGYKRAANILAQAEEKDGVEYSFGADRKFAETPAEAALFDALEVADAAIKPALAAEDFTAAMAAMAQLRAPVDAFFEAVQVNADNPVLRRNRLNLLSVIRTTCRQVADLSHLQG